MQIAETSAGFELRFPFDRVKISAIKQIEHSYWNATKKVWVVPKSKRSDLERLIMRFKKPLPPGNYSAMPAQIELVQGNRYEVDKTLPDLRIDIPLKKTLRPYQGPGAQYAIDHSSCLMGDQQGTGKTITSIAAVVALNAFPCLVICKSSLQLNWKKEWIEWTDKTPIVFNDSVTRTWPAFFRTNMAQVAICTYDSMKKYFVQVLGQKKEHAVFSTAHIILREATSMFKSVIIDESHYIKDPGTMRTRLAIAITKGKEHVYCLSGTPILNEPVEIYPQLVAMGKSHLFGNYDTFRKMYSKDNPRIREALHFLNYMLHKNCYFRRLKSDVAKDIPPKTRQVVLCEIDNRDEYNRAKNNFSAFLNDQLASNQGRIDSRIRAESLIKMEELKKISARGKLKEVYEWITDLIEEDEKVVVFAHHREITGAIKAKFPGSVSILGSDDNPTRQRNKEKFMSDPDCKVIVCSNGAAAEGHTLTAACNIGLVELPWHFGKAEQIEDRIHRISQELPVTCSYFIAENTIDRQLYEIIMAKKDMHDGLTGTDEEVHQETVDKLINLFNQQ